ncbi:MAG TPA: hypothetical protein VNX28_01445, partial [Gemmataceae bacterium]|nr:hypothetical protein [Gemmataceae bacterium]
MSLRDWLDRKRDQVMRFDLSRFTLIGWLVFLLTIAVLVIVAIEVGTIWKEVPGQQDQAHQQPPRALGIPLIAVALLFFF